MQSIKNFLNLKKTGQKTNYVLLFLFSFTVDVSFGYKINIINLFTLFFTLIFLLNFIRPLYIVITLFLTLMATLYFPIGRLFGPPNYNSFIAAFYTSPEETLGFLSDIPFMYYAGSFLVFILGILSFRLKIYSFLGGIKITFMLFFLIFTIGYNALKSAEKQGNFNFKAIGFTPIKFLQEAYETKNYVKAYDEQIKKSITIEDSWDVISSNPKYKNYILVIGESVRKDFMHNYGFNIENTPFSTDSNGLFFENYLSAGPSTVLSLTSSLAKQHENELQLYNNVVSLAKKAGFYTYWISNQHYLGEWDTPISVIGKNADSALFIKMTDPIKFGNATDDALLPFVKKCLTDTTVTKNKLIILHLMGSHPPFCKRTKGKFKVHFHSKPLSCYVQSVYNTDKLLKNIAMAAQCSKKSWSMMYFSDHGLALENGRFGHNDKYQENYRVPMFIISSDDEKKQSITAYRSGFYFLYLFSQWTSIKEKSLITDFNYLSNKEYSDQFSVFLGNKKKIDIRTLPLNPIKN